MKILLITVAGISSRFSQSIGKPCLKCIYYRKSIEESLLYRMIHQSEEFDRYVIVGGFHYDELRSVLKQSFPEYREKIILVQNEKYAEYGSGYSLYLGLKQIMDLPFSQIVFAEGDLYIDHNSFMKVCQTNKDVITCNKEAILANKAVAFYYDQQCKIHYIYDTQHNALQINVPFLGIYNSGQIWKFSQPERLRRILGELDEKDRQGTNLIFIQKYFEDLDKVDYEIVRFDKWINCNTIVDFDLMEGI